MATTNSPNDSNENGKRDRNEDDSLSEPPNKAIKNDATLIKVEDGAAATSEKSDESNLEECSKTLEVDSIPQQSNTLNSESDGVDVKKLRDNESLVDHDGSKSISIVDEPIASQASSMNQLGLNSSETLTSVTSANAKAPVHDPRKAINIHTSTYTPPAPPIPMVGSTPQTSTANSSQIIEEKGEVSPLYVGRVIGKGGEMIRDLQARSGARIDVDQNVPPGHPRVITYKGTRETVEFAKQLVAILSREGASENDLPLGHAAVKHLVIPAQSVGKVIGRGGEMIRELQSRSQAKIQIDHTGRSGHPPDQKLVTITGNKEAVAKGAEMVNFLVANPLMDAQQSLNMLIEEKTRTGLPWGSGPPYVNLPNQGVNMNPQAMQQSAPYGSGNYHQQFNNPPPMGYAPIIPGGMAPPHQQSLHHDQGFNAAPGGREIDIVYAAKQYMGRIIGGKGVTVNDLQRRSGCEIQINQDVPQGQDCEITLKGTRHAIEAAKHMIKDIIETGPQHPYAGGADTYGTASGYQPAQAAQLSTASQPFGFQQGFDQNYSQPAYNPPAAYIQPTFGQPAMVPQTYGGYSSHPQTYGVYTQQPVGTVQTFPPQLQIAPQPTKAPIPMQASPWKTATAPDGQVYYYNERTGGTQWEKPAGML